LGAVHKLTHPSGPR